MFLSSAHLSGVQSSGTGQLAPDKTSFKDSLNSFLCLGMIELQAGSELCDITVVVGDVEFPCHKMLLASASRFFRALFRNEPANDRVVLDSHSVSPESFALILRMIYEKVDGIEDSDTATDVLISAVFLQAHFIQEHCERFLVRHMKPENCSDMWQFADSYELKVLIEGAKKVARNKFEKIVESASFTRLPLPFVLALFSSDALVVQDEDNVLKAILKWVRGDVEQRHRHLAVLLPFVNFLSLSDRYTHTLCQTASELPAIQVYLNDGLTYKLESCKRLNSLIKREVLARQEVRVPTALADAVLVAIEDPTLAPSAPRVLRAVVLNKDKASEETRQLSPLPVDPGRHFATCVWRNELYLSGGSKNPRYFASYNAGIDKWETLQDLPESRMAHAMAAINSYIFLLGGHVRKLARSRTRESGPGGEDVEGVEEVAQTEVFAFSTLSETWGPFAHLTEPRDYITAAAFGHRIYVLGGRDATHQPSSLVECVDTLSGTVYRAARMPSAVSRVRALVSNSSIYVTLLGTDVYQLKENDVLAEKREAQLGDGQQQVAVSDSSDVEGQMPYLPSFTDKEQSRMAAVYRHKSKQSLVVTDDEQSGAEGVPVLSTTDLNSDGEADEPHGSPLASESMFVREIHTDAADAELPTVAFLRPSSTPTQDYFDRHLLYVPKLKDDVKFRHAFRPESLSEHQPTKSHRVKINNFDWYIAMQKRRQHNEDLLTLYLHKVKGSQGSWKVHTKYSFWVVPNRPGFAGVHTEDTSIFRDSKSVGFGHRQRLISLASLKDPTNGYVNEDGEVTVQASVTITAPPELESPEETSSIAEQPLPVTGVQFDLKPAMYLQPLSSV